MKKFIILVFLSGLFSCNDSTQNFIYPTNFSNELLSFNSLVEGQLFFHYLTQPKTQKWIESKETGIYLSEKTFFYDKTIVGIFHKNINIDLLKDNNLKGKIFFNNKLVTKHIKLIKGSHFFATTLKLKIIYIKDESKRGYNTFPIVYSGHFTVSTLEATED